MPTAHNSIHPTHPDREGQFNSQSSTALSEATRLQKLAANVPGAIYEYILHRDGSDEFSYISPGCREIYEVEPEAVLENPLSIWGLVHADDIDTLRHSVKNSAETLQPWQMEWRNYTYSGKLKWLSGSARPEKQSNGDIIWHGYIQDISDRKEAEETSKRRLEVIEAATVGIAILNPQREYTYLNQAYTSIYGYSDAKELLGKNWGEFYDPEEIKRLETEVLPILERQGHWKGEGTGKTWDGRTFTQEISLTLTHDGQLICICSDITERKLAEVALRESQRRYQTLTETSPICIFQTDPWGNCSYINDRWTEITGLRAKDALGQGWIHAIHPDDRERVFTEWYGAIVGKRRFSTEYRLLGAEGKIIWVMSQVMAEVGEDGRGVGYIGALADISDRKLAEREQQKFLTLIDRSSEFIGISDLNGKALYINQAGQKMVGLSGLEEASPIEIAEFVLPEDRRYFSEVLLPKVMAEGRAESDLRFRHCQKGEVIYVYSTVFTLIDPETGQPFALGTITRNITDRKQAEIALQEREQFLRSIYDGTEQAIFVLDVTPENDFRYVGWNPACERVSQLLATEVVGKSPIEIFGASNGEQVLQNYRKCLEAETTINYEEMLNFTGRENWFLTTITPLRLNGKIYRLVGTAVEITDRKRAELALSKSEAQLRELARREQLINRLASQIGNSLDLDTILETTVQQLRDLLDIDLCVFTWYRPHAQPPLWEVYKEVKTAETPSIIGAYTTDEIGILARRILKGKIVRYDDVVAISLPKLRDSLLERGYRSILGLPIQTASGELGSFICINFNEVRHWSDGEVELLASIREQLAIAIDRAELYEQATAKTQELKASITQLRRTQSQLIQAEKMSSLGQLVAGVAHEINNPVSFIYGNLTPAQEYIRDLLGLMEMYEQYYPNPAPAIAEEIENIELEFLAEDLPKLLNSIKVGAERIKEIVKSLRTFSRLDEAEVKEVDIHENIDSTLMILQTKLKHGPNHSEVKVITNYGKLPLIECYAGQLNQVFMNIISNAIDALNERDKNRSLEEMKANPSTIEIKTAVNKERVEITIADNGIGIEKEAMEKIFDPFYTTKPIGKGTGLGLSISYQIVVDKHGGDLRCLSQWGEGTKFIIELPVAIKKNWE